MSRSEVEAWPYPFTVHELMRRAERLARKHKVKELERVKAMPRRKKYNSKVEYPVEPTVRASEYVLSESLRELHARLGRCGYCGDRIEQGYACESCLAKHGS